MVWESISAMTVFDLIVILTVAVVVTAFWRERRRRPEGGSVTYAPVLILAGLAFLSMFYVVDLLSMHALPLFIGVETAHRLMTLMHLEVSWFVTVVALLLISAGFIQYDAANRRSMLALAASEARYRSIVRDQSEYIVRWQPGGIRVWVNEPYCQAFGGDREQLIGTSFFPLISESDRERVMAELERLTPDAPARTGVHKVKNADGRSRWHEWMDRALFDETGRLIEIQSVGRDITDRLFTERALKESEARFRGFVESTSDWVWEIDDQRRYVYCNEQVEHLLGYSADELIGTDMQELVHSDDAGVPAACIGSLQRNKHSSQCCNFRIRRRDGSYRYFEHSAKSILDDSGKLIGYRGVSCDQTFATLLARLSLDLVGCPIAELDQRIRRSLGQIGLAYGLERASFWWLGGTYARRSHEWAAEGMAGPRVKFVSDENIPWMGARVFNGVTVKVESLDDLPEGIPDREFLRTQGVMSTMAIPILEDDQLIGVAVYSTVSRETNWSDDLETELRHLSEKIVSVYAQAEATRKILRREADLNQSEALAHVGSFAFYPFTDQSDFPRDWYAEFSAEQRALFEVDEQDISFETLLSRIHEEDRQDFSDGIQALLRGGTEVTMQCRAVTSSGEERHFANRTRIDRDENGRNVRIIGSNRDVTEQVHREESLKEALGEIEELKDRLELENIQLREEVRSIHGFEQIIGDSEPLRRCLELVARVAPTDATVLLLGETGTGKELIAKAIHELSARCDEPMVSLNCTALPAELVESELFGHERGAFTGAHRKRLGRFEVADGGTLFLDEIGDLPGDLQAKLLRVLQDGTYSRVGGTRTRHADVRLIAATNRNLQEAVDAGTFRSDLYYRINTVPIQLPALRERKADIPLLAQHFLQKHGPRLNKSVDAISASTLRYLQAQEWPGNIRELEHTIERSLIASRGNVLTVPDRDVQSGSDGYGGTSAGDLRAVERHHIVQILKETRWVIGGEHGAASRLGLPASTLRSRMKKLGIERAY